MIANWIDPVVKNFLFYASPWKTSAGKRNLLIIIAVTLVLSVLGWIGLLEGNGVMTLLRWTPFAIVGSIIGYLIIAFFDRERRVRFFHFFTILIVMFVSSEVAAFLNDHSPAKMITVGFFEEAFKILPVLLLAIYVPNLIKTRKDGIVYGAMAGFGFNFIETASYIQTALADSTVTQALVLQLTRTGLWGISAHIIWSAFVGMGIGWAMERNRSGFWAKWKPAIITYLIAAVWHSINDLGGLLIGLGAVMGIEFLMGLVQGVASFSEEACKQVGPMNNAMRYGALITNLGFLIVLIIQIRRSFAAENKIQVEKLSDEDPIIVHKAELELVKAEKLFSKRKYTDYPKATADKLVLYQNMLAMQKHTANVFGRDVEEDQGVSILRKGIRALRSSHPVTK